MPVVSVAYEIPVDILVGLSAGELTRFGSVVRDSKKIIQHLKEVPMTKEPNYKAIAIGLGVVAVAAVGGLVLVAAKSSKGKKSSESKVPKCVADFNDALLVYLEAIQNGSLDIKIITNLISCLDKIKKDYNSGKIEIDFTIGQLDTLSTLIFDYTKKLAEANSIKSDGLKETLPVSTDNKIIDLQRYLEIQQQIFEKVS